jgi:hypothetical protein
MGKKAPKQKLKKIPVGSSSESGHINPRRKYRVRVEGQWYEGSFTKKWFGWCFEGGGVSGLQLNLIDQVYEIVVERPDKKPMHPPRTDVR